MNCATGGKAVSGRAAHVMGFVMSFALTLRLQGHAVSCHALTCQLRLADFIGNLVKGRAVAASANGFAKKSDERDSRQAFNCANCAAHGFAGISLCFAALRFAPACRRPRHRIGGHAGCHCPMPIRARRPHALVNTHSPNKSLLAWASTTIPWSLAAATLWTGRLQTRAAKSGKNSPSSGQNKAVEGFYCFDWASNALSRTFSSCRGVGAAGA